ncbi:hypothetical protein L0152_07760, partial [bacterium]|nr:hypothetical protein [bacterium]
ALSDLEKNEINKKLEKAEGELDQLILDLRMSNPEYAELKYPEPYNLRKLRKELDKDTALLEFFVGEDRSYVFVVTSSAIQWASIPGRVQLEEGVRKYRETISKPPQALIGQDAERLQRDYEQQAHSLYEQLIKPIHERRKTEFDFSLGWSSPLFTF